MPGSVRPVRQGPTISGSQRHRANGSRFPRRKYDDVAIPSGEQFERRRPTPPKLSSQAQSLISICSRRSRPNLDCLPMAVIHSVIRMAIRTVRLDDEAEDALREIREATGVAISEALKQGLRSLRQQVRDTSRHRPYALYERLDLGPGGYAIASSSETRRGVAEAIRKKLRK